MATLCATTVPLHVSGATVVARPTLRAVRPAAVAVPILKLNQPAGASCAAVKIVDTPGKPWWAVVNCNNGRAYNYNGAAAATVLALPGGAVNEQAYDIGVDGYSVGVAFTGGGVAIPMLWNPAGAPLPFGACGAVPATAGIAAGLYKAGWLAGVPVVGQNQSGVVEACWWAPGAAHLIPPAPAAGNTSFAYDVNTVPVYVGQLNGRAAAGPGAGGPLAAIPGTAPSSVAYAINTGSYIVGHQDLGGACGAVQNGSGFASTFPGAAAAVGPLPGDCTAGLEDDNDAKSAVGYSAKAGLKQALGFNLAAPYPAGLFNLNTGVAPHPWALLSDAAGIDDMGDIIATDTGVAASQVYVLI